MGVSFQEDEQLGAGAPDAGSSSDDDHLDGVGEQSLVFQSRGDRIFTDGDEKAKTAPRQKTRSSGSGDVYYTPAGVQQAIVYRDEEDRVRFGGATNARAFAPPTKEHADNVKKSIQADAATNTGWRMVRNLWHSREHSNLRTWLRLAKEPPPAYSDRYWEKRYMAQRGQSFDWYCDYPRFKQLLHSAFNRSRGILGVVEKQAASKDDIETLILGNGSSELPIQLYDAGYRNVTCIDTNELVVEIMNRKFAAMEQEVEEQEEIENKLQHASKNARSKSRTPHPEDFLEYLQLNMKNLSDCFPENSFTAVIDKATMDIYESKFVERCEQELYEQENKRVQEQNLKQNSKLMKTGGSTSGRPTLGGGSSANSMLQKQISAVLKQKQLEEMQGIVQEIVKVLRPGGFFFSISALPPEERIEYLSLSNTAPWKIDVSRILRASVPFLPQSQQQGAGVPSGARSGQGGNNSSAGGAAAAGVEQNYYCYICTLPVVS
ncbi:unnamed protein product [Amoebophrya sp. A120]|nr:unnamed protein product [Amoebophrya sp. A120]|eukprot:GSA120T00010513001.1